MNLREMINQIRCSCIDACSLVPILSHEMNEKNVYGNFWVNFAHLIYDTSQCSPKKREEFCMHGLDLNDNTSSWCPSFLILSAPTTPWPKIVLLQQQYSWANYHLLVINIISNSKALIGAAISMIFLCRGTHASYLVGTYSNAEGCWPWAFLFAESSKASTTDANVPAKASLILINDALLCHFLTVKIKLVSKKPDLQQI